MTDNFINLVSQANPAARQQYQPTQNGYPPTSPYGMDPFFDDDDEMPDSAFAMGRPPTAPMQSQESGLPLRSAAAPPAGSGQSKTSLPHEWNFDDEEVQVPSKPFRGSAAFPGMRIPMEKGPTKSMKWRWPWQKEKVLLGERIVALNNSAMNSEYCSNSVSTSKYNMLSFTFKFLYGQSAFVLFIYIYRR
jgi:phospholipid-transporting ATPase